MNVYTTKLIEYVYFDLQKLLVFFVSLVLSGLCKVSQFANVQEDDQHVKGPEQNGSDSEIEPLDQETSNGGTSEASKV